MRFEEAYGGWQARLLGVCERTFRRYVDRNEDEGFDRAGGQAPEPSLGAARPGR